jgi:hypothetical protein
MSLFNFFRRSEKAIETQVEPTVEPIVNETIFLDNEEPSITELEGNKSAISVFLDKDYIKLGYHDGYLYPNGELMDGNLKKIRSDFRMAIDRVIDDKRSVINNLKLHQIGTRGISERLDEELTQKLEELYNLINELDTQKILSIENEGLISSCINDYKIGFIKGIEQYRREKIFVGNTHLF